MLWIIAPILSSDLATCITFFNVKRTPYFAQTDIYAHAFRAIITTAQRQVILQYCQFKSSFETQTDGRTADEEMSRSVERGLAANAIMVLVKQRTAPVAADEGTAARNTL
jgi:hypothetical protein